MTRVLLVAALVGVLALVVSCSDSGSEADADDALALEEVLARVEHPHDMAIDADGPQRVWLGLHGGLYRSEDGGHSWRLAALEDEDAMNLAAGRDGSLWVAGHNVLVRSEDGGERFSEVRPDGLPNLDLHGFAVREGRPQQLVAAAAGEGLYRSVDGGQSFALLTRDPGAGVFGLEVRRDGRVIAADPQRGVMISADGGYRFRTTLASPGLVSLATDPRRPDLVIAAGEPGVLVSEDGGQSFAPTFSGTAIAAVALDPADPDRGLALGANGELYATADRGQSWAALGDGR